MAGQAINGSYVSVSLTPFDQINQEKCRIAADSQQAGSEIA